MPLNSPYIPTPVFSGPLVERLVCPKCGNGEDKKFDAETQGVGSQPSKETKLVGYRCSVCRHLIPELHQAREGA